MKKYYLKTFNYNTYLIINELAKIVKNHGGHFVNDFPCINTYKKFKIMNRTLLYSIDDIKIDIQGATEKQKKTDYFIEKQKELEKLEKIDNSYKKVIFKNYIHFYLDGYIYYVQINDTFLDDDHIQKEKAEKIKGGYIVKYEYYMENLSNKWRYFSNIDLFDFLSKKEIRRFAKRLFDQIINYKTSDIVTNKKRVLNNYDYRYHYEYIKEERNKKYKIINVL